MPKYIMTQAYLYYNRPPVCYTIGADLLLAVPADRWTSFYWTKDPSVGRSL